MELGNEKILILTSLIQNTYVYSSDSHPRYRRNPLWTHSFRKRISIPLRSCGSFKDKVISPMIEPGSYCIETQETSVHHMSSSNHEYKGPENLKPNTDVTKNSLDYVREYHRCKNAATKSIPFCHRSISRVSYYLPCPQSFRGLALWHHRLPWWMRSRSDHVPVLQSQPPRSPCPAW